MIPFCDTPGQSAVAGVVGGVAGGAAGVALGLDLVAVVLLAAVLAGALDLGAHVARGDAQFRAAVADVRERAGR